MHERDRDGIRRIQQNLVENKGQQEQKSSRVEGVRRELVRIANETKAKYKREEEAMRPDAEVAVKEIIQPWFSDLIASGTYEDLLRWSRFNEYNVYLSETILYYWPNRALKEIASGDSKLYKDKAEFVVERYKGSDIKKGIQSHADRDNVWHAGFKMGRGRWRDNTDGLRIWRWPVVGGGFAFSQSAIYYEIPVNEHSVAFFLDRISPEVWVEFGKQIESGKAWDAIERSMKPKKRASAREATERDVEEEKRVAQEYLRNRQWH